MSDAKKAALAHARANIKQRSVLASQGGGKVFGVPVEILFFGAAVVLVVAVVRRNNA